MKHEISWDRSLRAFIQQSASAEPTPGGGSVSAVVAALGASMASMVGSLSLGEKFADVRDRMQKLLAEMKELTAQCEKLFAEDIHAFEQYMDAIKLPKHTEEEKKIRVLAIREAADAAIDVPLRLMEVCREGLRSLHAIAEASNGNVISDLGIGAILFEAAAQSALLTVEINLGSIKDTKSKDEYAQRSSVLIGDIAELKNQALSVARQRIKG